MIKRRSAIAVMAGVVFAVAFVATAADNAKPKATALGFSYDEGLSAKAYLLDNVYTTVSLFYSVAGARDTGDQPLNTGLLKIGGGYVLKDIGNIRLSAFGEIGGRFRQEQTDSVQADLKTHTRYNTYDGFIRVGLNPEWFVSDFFSINYKLGLEYFHFGTEYQLVDHSYTKSKNNAYDRFRTYGLGENYTQRGINDDAGTIVASLLMNIGFTFYIYEFPFLGFLKK